MENEETTEEGAARETVEEAGASIIQGEALKLFSIVDVPTVHQVHLFFLAPLSNNLLAPGSETIEAKFFSENEIPWQEIAFKTVSLTLQWFFEAKRNNDFTMHQSAVRWKMPSE